MADIKDGGPAFPVEVDSTQPHGRQTGNSVWQAYGISMRDYIATHEPMDPNESIGLALAERLAGRPHPAPRDESGKFKAAADPVEVAVFWADAEAAYRYLRADAMLRAREVNHG